MIGLASAQQQEEQQQQNQQAQSGSLGGIYRLSFFEFDVLSLFGKVKIMSSIK